VMESGSTRVVPATVASLGRDRVFSGPAALSSFDVCIDVASVTQAVASAFALVDSRIDASKTVIVGPRMPTHGVSDDNVIEVSCFDGKGDAAEVCVHTDVKVQAVGDSSANADITVYSTGWSTFAVKFAVSDKSVQSFHVEIIVCGKAFSVPVHFALPRGTGCIQLQYNRFKAKATYSDIAYNPVKNLVALASVQDSFVDIYRVDAGPGQWGGWAYLTDIAVPLGPAAVCWTSDGNELLIADVRLRRITRYRPDGTQIGYVCPTGTLKENDLVAPASTINSMACRDDLIAVTLSAVTCLLMVIRRSTGEVLVKHELVTVSAACVSKCGGVAFHPSSGHIAVALVDTTPSIMLFELTSDNTIVIVPSGNRFLSQLAADMCFLPNTDAITLSEDGKCLQLWPASAFERNVGGQGRLISPLHTRELDVPLSSLTVAEGTLYGMSADDTCVFAFDVSPESYR
jgi:hypothetical protein